jgi:hypothetical protein
MRNWFTELCELKKGTKKDYFPDSSQLKEFHDFLGCSWPECILIAWLCMNYKSRGSHTVLELYENLAGMVGEERITEALIDLMASGWINVSSEDVRDLRYELAFTHKIEVALRSGNNSIFSQKIKPADQMDRSILGMYAHAVLFKSKITDADAWIQIANIYLDISQHPLAKAVRKAKLNRLNQAVVLYIYLMYAAEGSLTDWKSLANLFTENSIAAKRALYEWKNPNWKPLLTGLLEIRQYPVGPAMLCPTEKVQRRIFGYVEDGNKKESPPPSSLQLIRPFVINPKKLLYNPAEREKIDVLRRLLQPTALKKYQRQMKMSGKQAGIAVLLSGDPGTGKTELARQLARSTERDLLMFNVAEQRDKYFGESEKRIKEVFDYYRNTARNSDRTPILFFNEGDSVFQNRKNLNTEAGATENTIQTILLNELEVFEGILICTTNRPDSFDSAFNRRFLLQVSIQPPEESVRAELIKLQFDQISNARAMKIASEYEFTAADLENFQKINCMHAIVGKQLVDIADSIETYMQSVSKSRMPQIGFRTRA